jgi:hypothetical protein
MDNNEKNTETAFAEGAAEEPILPEGYAEGDDIFEEKSGLEAGQAASGQEQADSEENPEAQEEPSQPAETGTKETAPKERDFEAEALEFYRANPDYVAKQLPDRVVDAWVEGKTLQEAWRGDREAETERLKKELQTLRQTVKNQQRAPVSGVSGYGAADSGPDDPFLDGLRAEW